MRQTSNRNDRRPGSRTSSNIALDIAAEGDRWTCLGARPLASAARETAAALATAIALPTQKCAATLMLSHDAQVQLLNKQWRGFDKPTNVLSFPSAVPTGVRVPNTRHLGDIILAEETVVREARDMGLAVGDHYRHLVLHGLLHLLGYDHETDGQAEEMEALETSILATLGIADPYAGTEPVRTEPSSAARAGRARPAPVRKP